MLNSKDNKKIKICILEMSSQNKSILEFFFENAGKSLFEESTTHNASAFIIDYDYPGAKESIELLHETTQIPGILVSIKEVSQPSAIWISKPITSKALIEARKKLTDIISSPKEQVITKPPVEVVSEKPIEEPIIIETTDVADIEDFSTLTETAESTLNIVDNHLSIDEVSTTKEKIFEAEDFYDLEIIADTNTNETLAYTEAQENHIEHSQSSTVQVEKKQNTVVQEEAVLVSSGASDYEPSSDPFDLDSEFITTQDRLNTFEPKQKVIETIADNDNSNDKEIDFLLDSLIADDENIINDDSKKDSQTDEFSSLIVENNNADLTNTEESLLIDFNINNSTTHEEPKLEEFDDLLSTDDSLAITDFSLVVDDISSNKKTLETIALETTTDSTLTPIEEKTSINLDPEIVIDNTVNELPFEQSIPIEPSDQLINEKTSDETETTNFDNLTLSEDPNINSVEPETTVNDVQEAEIFTDDIAVQTEPLQDEIISPEAIQVFEDSANNISDAQLASTSNDAEDKKMSAEDELESLLEEIREEAEGRPSKSHQYNNQGSRYTPTIAEERWALTCGDESNDSTSYKVNEHMLSTLLKVLEHSKKTKKVMRLKFSDTVIVIDIETDTIYCDISIYDNSYAEICFDTIDQTTIKIHSLDTSEIRQYRKLGDEEVNLAHSIEAFIWTTSLLTSRGRLPKGTNTQKVVGLKHWPNLTRLEKIPNVMQIAAIFYKHPGSLANIPLWLNINKNYIYAFYNAVLYLNMIESDENIKASSSLKNGAFKKTKNSGFFSRLLKRINT